MQPVQLYATGAAVGSLQFYFLTIIQIIMKKKVTFSRKFPAKHPRAGELTHFIEKILIGLSFEQRQSSLDPFSAEWKSLIDDAYFMRVGEPPKYHTIRAGKNWKVGDILIPCVWELDGGRFTKGNKKIQCAPELEVVKVWDAEIKYLSSHLLPGCEAISIVLDDEKLFYEQLRLAENDGLSYEDFRNWFMMDKKSFSGQVICWNKEVEY